VKDNSNYRLDPPGLDPAGGAQVSKVWWDGEKLMAKPIPFVEFYKPVQDSTCRETLRAQGKAYPRTCRKCGLGPCIGAPKQLPTQPATEDSSATQPAPVREPVKFNEELHQERERRQQLEAELMRMQGRELKLQMALNTPAAQRQWVGLAHEEIAEIVTPYWDKYCDFDFEQFAQDIEAKLKERNV
jgi:hypothetical protein